MIDNRTVEKARQIADRAHHLPDHTPGAMGAYAALIGFLICLCYRFIASFGHPDVALLLAPAIAGAVSFLDANQKFGLHSKVFADAIKRLEAEEDKRSL